MPTFALFHAYTCSFSLCTILINFGIFLHLHKSFKGSTESAYVSIAQFPY